MGAGGGSIAWRDPGGALRVGPRSAGAEPGPACYGRGGTEPTVTDANLMLGYLPADRPLAGAIELRRDLAEEAITRLASSLKIDPTDCAAGILRVANAEMVRALRVVTVQRGIDPRGYALLAFGGAGPLHAAAIAEELGIEWIVCPRASGVLAALGLVVSPRRRDVQRSVLWTGESLTAESVAAEVRELSDRAREALGEPDADLSAVYELRYRGQAFELAIAADLAPELEQLRGRFEGEHEDRYGYSDPSGELELVTIRVSATVPGAEVELGDAAEGARPETTSREATLGGEQRKLTVLRGAPLPGAAIEGAAVVELAESTLLVPDGWAGEVDATGTIQIRREGGR